MPTIDDLHAAFAQLERGAPTEIADAPGPATSNVEIVHALLSHPLDGLVADDIMDASHEEPGGRSREPVGVR